MLLYFLAINLWTLGQTHILGGLVDREQRQLREAEERAAAARTQASRPKPGQRPRRR